MIQCLCPNHLSWGKPAVPVSSTNLYTCDQGLAVMELNQQLPCSTQSELMCGSEHKHRLYTDDLWWTVTYHWTYRTLSYTDTRSVSPHGSSISETQSFSVLSVSDHKLLSLQHVGRCRGWWVWMGAGVSTSPVWSVGLNSVSRECPEGKTGLTQSPPTLIKA